MCSVIVQRDGPDLYVVDEIRLGTSSSPVRSFAVGMGDTGRRRFGSMATRAGSCRTTNARTDHELIRKHFRGDWRFEMLVERSNPAVRDRINLVNSRLCSADGERRLFVAPKCRGLIEDFEQVTYKADSAAIDKDRNPERTHLSDALGYLLWQEYRAAGRAGERSERLF
ncbi:MAG: hypothetical protein R2748_23160 [Bryobacterales bacterium]